MAEAAIATTQSFYRRWWARARTSFFWIVLLALALRLGIIVIGHTYKFKTLDNNFSFGWEMGRIGRSLSLGQGFSNPFNEATGPTAWEPPLYPFLIAGVFKLFGVYTHASALVLLTINSIFSALTCIPIFLIARRCFGESTAIWTAWLWALLPNVTYWCTRWVWETSVAALLMALLFWLALVMEEKEGWQPWFGFGLLWGIAALTNTSLLAFLPPSGLYIWYRRWKLGKRSLGGVVLASCVFVACITPWLIRNDRVFGQPIFIRSNFGAELRIGNGPGADGTWQEYLHPTQNAHEMHRYEQLGELEYVKVRKREAVTWIKENPATFAFVSFKKFVYYWGGIPKLSIFPPPEVKNSLFLASSVFAFLGLYLALRNRRPGAWLFLWLILSYPTIYYFVFPHPRYRHPIEPELAILIVYAVSQAEIKKRTN
jgi:4-amino-4-deoxy-L-arabinose transferase-like glycosyltransferase